MAFSFSTYEKINPKAFYFSLNFNAKTRDELFGLSLGRIYIGWYKNDGLYSGWIDDHESFRNFGQ